MNKVIEVITIYNEEKIRTMRIIRIMMVASVSVEMKEIIFIFFPF